MPVMCGADVVAESRRVQPDLPALLVTGYTNFTHGAGAELPRLAKPFRQAELASRVADLIEADRSVNQHKAQGQPAPAIGVNGAGLRGSHVL